MLINRGRKPGGMISGGIREGGVRIGFKLEDILTHETGILAHINQNEGPRIGKYRVSLPDIERIGVTAIRRAVTEADVVIVDEIGPMELCSKPFILSVETALASPMDFVGTIHKRASHNFVTSIKSNPTHEVIEVTFQNRREVPSKIVDQITVERTS